MSEAGDRAAWPVEVSPALPLVESAWAGWLGYAFAAFTGLEGSLPLRCAAVLAVAGGIASVVAGVRPVRPVRVLLALAGFALLARLGGTVLSVSLTWPAVAWLTVVAGFTGALLRIPASPLCEGSTPARVAEAVRWLALLLTATLLLSPFYTWRPLGAGDAHWYSLMLADYVAQVRAGIFPVWMGQTEYAFNGAVSPLRLAPWFQHSAALLDLLTARRLDFIALKNALLAVNFLLLAGTAYACLRRLMPGRPTAACLLALLFLDSPAVLAPLYTGDQYMTFCALPFACLAVYGVAGVLDDDRAARYPPLCIGLAGLWLTHAPVAIWLSAFLVAAIAVALVFSRAPGWWRRLGLAALVAALLGSYPVISTLSLENTNPLDVQAIGVETAKQVVATFPGIFLPLSAKLTNQTDYQLGYTLLALAALAGLGLCRHRTRPGLALALALGLVILLLLPVAAWAHAIWPRLPLLLMKISGIWPYQRLVPIAAVLVVFLAALAQRDWPWPAGRWSRGGLVLLALAGLVWSGFQAAGFVRAGRAVTATGAQPLLGFQTNNLALTRYAFSSFATTPGYFSHGYIDPRLEHRLLNPDRSVLAANATAAASAPVGTLVARGTFTAVNEGGTPHYNLTPRPWLPGRQHLVLKVEPLEKIERGWFQVVGEDVFREYILPDSGAGVVRNPPGRAFGTQTESTPWLPLRTLRPDGEAPRLTVILPDLPVRASFPFARFELWQFDPARLPVAVRSWAPYRLHVSAPTPALVETPRLWLAGYHAVINGQRVPVQRSPDNLAMFPVDAGESEIAIGYDPPFAVAASYWLTLAAWVALLAWLTHQRWRGDSTAAG